MAKRVRVTCGPVTSREAMFLWMGNGAVSGVPGKDRARQPGNDDEL